MKTEDRDLLIRRAIVPDQTVWAPPDLGDAIYRSIVATPQRRALGWDRPFGGTLARSFITLVLIALLIVAALATYIVLTRPAVAPPTNFRGGPDRTGVMPGPGPAAPAGVIWHIQRGGAISAGMMPLPVDGRVLLGQDDGTFASLDASTGSEAWRVPVGSPILSSPALADDLAIFGSDSGLVTALHTADGTNAWQRPVANGPVRASTVVEDGVAYIGGEDGTLYALDAATGSERWSIAIGGAITRGGALRDGVMYVGATGGAFVAVEVATGKPLWTVALGPGEVGTPAVDASGIYVGRGLQDPAGGHDLVALDRRDGSVMWTFPSASGKQVHVGGLVANALYAVSEDDNLYALSPATGAEMFRATTEGPIGTALAISGNVVFVTGGDQVVRALDGPTLRELWEVDLGRGTLSAPSVKAGRLFVGTSLGEVFAIGSPPAGP